MGPAPWESALVGQRIAGTTESQLEQWLARRDIAQAGNNATSWSAHYLMVWSTLDRLAPSDLAERIQHLGHEPRGINEGDGRTASYPGVEQGVRYIVGRSTFGASRRAPLKYQAAVESDAPLFARALVPFQHGDFATAVSRFDDLAARYPIERRFENADAVYALPDFSYASAKSGDSLKLEEFLSALPKDSDCFEMRLARTYFRALTHHDIAGALSSLDQARLWIEHYAGRTPSWSTSTRMRLKGSFTTLETRGFGTGPSPGHTSSSICNRGQRGLTPWRRSWPTARKRGVLHC